MHEQQQSLKGDVGTSGADLDIISYKKQSSPFNQHRRQRLDFAKAGAKTMRQPSHPSMHRGDKCGHCSREKPSRDKCPAREAQCHSCQCKGHYSAMCYQRVISTVSEEPTEEPTDTAFLDTITDYDMKWWTSVLIVNEKQIPFKLDTGVEVTAISKKTWEELGEPALKLSDKYLFGPTTCLFHLSCHMKTEKPNRKFSWWTTSKPTYLAYQVLCP